MAQYIPKPFRMRITSNLHLIAFKNIDYLPISPYAAGCPQLATLECTIDFNIRTQVLFLRKPDMYTGFDGPKINDLVNIGDLYTMSKMSVHILCWVNRWPIGLNRILFRDKSFTYHEIVK